MTTYCILNPISKRDEVSELSACGINIRMNKKYIYQHSDIIIFFKGEIYNLQILISYLHLPSDTKLEYVIIQLYKTYGMEYTLQVLDGVFSFIIFDYYYENIISNIYIVKDNFGIIPFYCFTNNKTIIFTEDKEKPDTYNEYILYPGSYTIYELGYKVNAEWVLSTTKNRQYFLVPNSIISSPIDKYSVSLYHLYKCMKSIIYKMTYINDQNQSYDIITEKLFLQIDLTLETQYDIEIYDDITKEIQVFSPINFLIDPKTVENMFIFDNIIRQKIKLTEFVYGKKYPFYDKSFINLYFSIPLHIRYNYHNKLFSIEKK